MPIEAREVAGSSLGGMAVNGLVNASAIGVAVSCAQAPSTRIDAITGAVNPIAAN